MGTELTVIEGRELLAPETIKKLTEKVQSIMSRAQGLTTINGQQEADEAGLIVEEIGPVRKFIGSVCDPICDELNKKHKAATGLRKFFDAPMASLEVKFKNMIGEFVMMRERERKKQEALLQVQVDKEHKKEVRVVSATVGLMSGTQAAEEIRDEMADAAPVVMEKTRVAGVSVGTVWRGEVVDAVAFVKGLASGKIPISMFDVEASSAKVNKQAAALDGKIDYPGIRVWEGPKVGRSGRS